MGGDSRIRASPIVPSISVNYETTPSFDVNTNSYSVDGAILFTSTLLEIQAIALCANFNFPMNMGGMIGGELLDINTVSLLVGSIGTNPIITGLVAITLGGVAAQVVWFVHKKKKSNTDSV